MKQFADEMTAVELGRNRRNWCAAARRPKLPFIVVTDIRLCFLYASIKAKSF